MNIEQIERAAATSYKQGQAYFAGLFMAGKVPKCSGGYISGSCPAGDRFAAPYLCGKEYCPDCGKDGSPIHVRRVNKWMQLLETWGKVGYMVVTLPEEIREFFKNKEVLNDFRYQLRRKLKRDGYSQGLARWHFFGDCETCKGAGCHYCNNTGAGTNWHPHLNIFIKAGYMQPSELHEFIQDLQTWSRRYYVRLLRDEIEKRHALLEKHGLQLADCSTIFNEITLLQEIIKQQKGKLPVINYSYTNSKKKKINRVKYVLRSTFRIYESDLKEQLHNFRNCVRWGFSKVKAPKESMLCPVCAAKGLQHSIVWHSKENYLKQLTYKHYAKGIYTLSGGGNRDNKFIEPPPRTLRVRAAELSTWSQNKPARQEYNNISAS